MKQLNLKRGKIALAASALLLAPTLASAQVSIYGRAHVSADLLDDGADYSEVNLSSNSSRLGFKGEKKLDNGLTPFFQVETEINFAQGQGALWASRDTFVGVKGNFGSLRIGQMDSPFKAARDPANLFGDQVGDVRNITRAANGRFDERPANSIQYHTNVYSGFQLNLGYALHETNVHRIDDPATAGVNENKDSSISASVTYKEGATWLALAYESYNEGATRGERNALRLAGAYNVTQALKLVGLYQTADHETNAASEAAVYGLGAEYKVTRATAVKGQFFQRSADPADSDSTFWTLGVEHKLDDALRLYANYASVDNDAAVAITPWGQARTATPAGAAGETASAFSVGLRYDF